MKLPPGRLFRRRTPQLASPYFRPEFTQAVAAARSTPNVAVMASAGEPVGFLPFGRTKWNTGIPVGSRLSDFHGVIAPVNVACDPLELVRCSGLSSWRFDHLVATHTAFKRHAWQMAESPYVDLAQGYDVYRETLKKRMRFGTAPQTECRSSARSGPCDLSRT